MFDLFSASVSLYKKIINCLLSENGTVGFNCVSYRSWLGGLVV